MNGYVLTPRLRGFRKGECVTSVEIEDILKEPVSFFSGELGHSIKELGMFCFAYFLHLQRIVAVRVLD